MTPWKSGDPVGSGAVYMPDAKTKRAYSDQCKSEMIESYARHVLTLQTIQQRRKYLDMLSGSICEAVKASVSVLWGERP